jgi:ABC-2 type transport system ATP-binding protein
MGPHCKAKPDQQGSQRRPVAVLCASMNPVLHMRDLWVGTGPQARLRGLDLDLVAGQRLGLLGVNGAGKSTLLAVLAGTLAPTSGELLINEKASLAARRRVIGYLPQRVACYPELTVHENLDWIGRLHGMPPTDIRSTIERALEQVGLAAHSSKLAGQLSSGMLQRLGVAQALLPGPTVLLLDEPTASLDPVQMEQIRALIRSLPDTVSVILATHLFDDVLGVCDHVALIAEGRKVAERAVSPDMDLMQYFEAGHA